MTNKQLFVSAEDYKIMAGPDWPSYADYLNDVVAKKPEIQEEIDYYTATMRKDGIKFPINTKTACQSKWTWSTIYLNQLSTASCHRVNPIKFELADFDNFHNVPKKLDDRRLMLNGEWPQGGCEYCKNIEDAGGQSDRLHNLDIRGLTPPELEFDPTAIEVTPRIVEIFAQNTCNFSCVYCNGHLSSQIENENIKFGAFHRAGVNIPIIIGSTKAADEYFVKFIAWLEKNIQVLHRLHLLGGETLIQHNLMTSVLDILERNPNPNLEFCVFSNFNAPERYWKLYLNRIKDLQKAGNIKCFDLTASIDCWGPAAEYVRHGLDLVNFEERLAWASEQGDWLRLNINQTITAMTVRTMPELIAVVNKYNQYKHIGQYFEFYIGDQMFQHPQIFEYSQWADDFKRIFELMPTRTGNQQEAIPRMQGIQKQLQQVHKTNWGAVEQLQIYLDELDRRRKTNWRNIFPYLDVANQIQP